MKKRWMKSIIEASKAEAPVLPFSRMARQARKTAGLAPTETILKTA